MCLESRFATIPLVIAMAALGTFGAPGAAKAEWPRFGRAICTAPRGQTHSSITTDGADGAIITWQDGRSARVNVFANHVLASGQLDPAWPVNGQPLLTDSLVLAGADGGQFTPIIVSDGAGGAIVAWRDFRSPVTGGDVFAQHVLASGQVDPDWKVDGVGLCTIQGDQNNLAMVSDGAGGAILVWMDSRPGATVSDIFAHHLLATGDVDPLWPENGLPVCTAPGLQEFPVIIGDGAGGAIIAWDDQRSSTTGADIFAHHVLASGVVDRAYPVNGRAVCAVGGDQGRPTIVADGAGGAIIAWSDARIVATSHIFAEHVLASGALDPAWPAGGRSISNAGVTEGRPLAVSDGTGGAVVTWQAFTVHVNTFAQHVRGTGVVDPAWPAGGRALSITLRNQTFADIVTDGAGGAVVVWDDSLDVVAQHVFASGALDPAYPDTGRVVINLPSQEGDPALVATGAGGAIVAWTDARNLTSPDIFAMQVLEAVTTGVSTPPAPGFAFGPASPNPARAPLNLRFELTRETRVRLSIYDVNGRRVRELASGVRAVGPHTITWDLRDERGRAVAAGIFFARLEAQGRSLTQKVVTLK